MQNIRGRQKQRKIYEGKQAAKNKTRQEGMRGGVKRSKMRQGKKRRGEREGRKK